MLRCSRRTRRPASPIRGILDESCETLSWQRPSNLDQVTLACWARRRGQARRHGRRRRTQLPGLTRVDTHRRGMAAATRARAATNDGLIPKQSSSGVGHQHGRGEGCAAVADWCHATPAPLFPLVGGADVLDDPVDRHTPVPPLPLRQPPPALSHTDGRAFGRRRRRVRGVVGRHRLPVSVP
jgi:hypothetical protein